ncbi:MAG: SGNH/GDSL hydrolase family protein [Lachnotalea sp.]
MKDILKWCAIGDSFTYLNDHLEETGFRLKKGYLTHTAEKLKFPVHIANLGINGSATSDWLNKELEEADFYTILLGTNDWFSRHTPLGNEEDFQSKREGTIVGNLACILNMIRKYADKAPIIVMTPVERGDFVYIENPKNMAHGSYQPENGLKLAEVSEEICKVVRGNQIYLLDLHKQGGFTAENAVYFKRLNINGEIKDVSYPDYIGLSYNPDKDLYPYPKEAAYMTYDGLHPSDLGCERIAELLANRLNPILHSIKNKET